MRFKRWRLRYNLLALGAAALALLLIALAGFELRSEFARGGEQRAAVLRSYEARAQIQAVFSSLQDAETGQRGYVITGDERFLEPYLASTRRLDAQMAALDALFAEDRVQQQHLQTLEGLVEAKLASLQAPIAQRRANGMQVASDLVAAGRGKALMDQVRVVVGEMHDREAQALLRRSELSQRRTADVERMVTAVFGAVAALLIAGVFLIWRYLTTRRSLLETVNGAATRLEAIFESTFDPIITLNPSGSIETVNAAAERMFGYSRQELSRRDIGLLVDLAEDGDGPFLSRIGASRGALAAGLVRELSARRRNGETFPVDVALGAMELRSGVHVVASVRDISERRRVEEMKNEFVSTVSHELRTPLTSIAGSLGLLAGGAAGDLPAKAERLIQIAQSNTQRLVRLINDILDIEKMEAGKLTLELAPLDLQAVAQRSIDAMQGLADKEGVQLRVAAGEPAPLLGDLDRLTQVVVNLLSNAIKFSPPEGAVEVRVAQAGQIVRLTVRDHGPGIPPAFREQIFSKFAQGKADDGATKGGTGLGLAISKEIAERHGGRLWFESEPGEGAAFHLDLPAPATTEPAGEAGGLRLLIVEDDADAAAVLKQMLEADGLAADVAPTAREALSRARAQTYAAALVDLQLPDADGIALIRAFRSDPATSDLPIVVVSADVARGKARGRALPVLDWMEKPFDQERLRKAVATLFASQGGHRPVVLHVEDDPDILEVTASALAATAQLLPAPSLAAARRILARRRPDLVILDIGLPDGSGVDLLPELVDESGKPIPVVIYSAQETDASIAGQAEAVLTKSRGSLAGLARTVRNVSANLGRK